MAIRIFLWLKQIRQHVEFRAGPVVDAESDLRWTSDNQRFARAFQRNSCLLII